MHWSLWNCCISGFLLRDGWAVHAFCKTLQRYDIFLLENSVYSFKIYLICPRSVDELTCLRTWYSIAKPVELGLENWMEMSLGWPLFFQYFQQFRQKNGQAFWGEAIQSLYSLRYTTHMPGPHKWQCPGPGPTPSASKQWKSDVHIENKTPCQRVHCWRNSRRNSNRAQQYINARVSPLKISATQNGRGTAESFVTLRETNPRRPTNCDSPEPLSHRFVSMYRKRLGNDTWIVISCNLELIFCVLDFHFRIAQGKCLTFFSDKIHQNSWPHGDLRSIHIIAFYIDWDWNIFSLHFFCSMLI